MRVLAIRGTGFIGPPVVRRLLDQGHDVAVFHRGHATAKLPEPVTHLIGDRNNLQAHAAELHAFSPDVVIDFVLSSGRQAQADMDVFRDYAGRIVALSSADVYRACGILHGTETGPLQVGPITEDAELRTGLSTYSPETIQMLKGTFAWLDDEYDKIPVERAIRSDAMLPGTVLRLPMVHGEGDRLHRLWPYLKRMNDGRPAILLQQDVATWTAPRGYVENVAAAIALAATSPQASGRIYNLGDPKPHVEIEWVRDIGRAVGWNGEIVALPTDKLPEPLRAPGNLEQHWDISTARIRKELGYVEPVPLEEALVRTIAWERDNPPSDSSPFDYAAEDAALASQRCGS